MCPFIQLGVALCLLSPRDPIVCSPVENGKYVWNEGTQIDGIAENPPASTLAPLYNPTMNNSLGYVIWNDEPAESHCPEGCPSFILGHSKGAALLLRVC